LECPAGLGETFQRPRWQVRSHHPRSEEHRRERRGEGFRWFQPAEATAAARRRQAGVRLGPELCWLAEALAALGGTGKLPASAQ
jgi:hypothetical protein